MKSGRWIAFGFTLMFLGSGCGQAQMVKTTGQVRQRMAASDYQGALVVLQNAKKGGAFKEQDRVMYWMNEGMLLHLLGQYERSFEVLQNAERRSEELFTKSLKKNIKAAFTSEAATDYPGEDYENVLVNVLKAFNFLAGGKVAPALIEARKINEKLVYYNSKYEKKSVYNQDAFAHWLMGLLFELEGSLDDARIAYEQALKTYKGDFLAQYGLGAPAYLEEDLMRVIRRNGDADLLTKYQGQYKATGASAELLKTKGEVILFHLNGEGPNKSDYFINCIFKGVANWYCDGEPGGEFIARKQIALTRPGYTALKIAFPRLHVRPPQNPFITMSVGGVQVRSEVALPINQIASKAFRDKTGRVFKNAIIRAVTKALTQAAAGAVGNKAGGKGLGWLASRTMSVVNQASEEADKRAWTTLPAQLEVARAWVAPGVHHATLQLPNGRMATIPNIKVEAGKRVFITFRTFP